MRNMVRISHPRLWIANGSLRCGRNRVSWWLYVPRHDLDERSVLTAEDDLDVVADCGHERHGSKDPPPKARHRLTRRSNGAQHAAPLQEETLSIGMGVDLAEVGPIRAAIERHGEAFLRRVVTAGE